MHWERHKLQALGSKAASYVASPFAMIQYDHRRGTVTAKSIAASSTLCPLPSHFFFFPFSSSFHVEVSGRENIESNNPFPRPFPPSPPSTAPYSLRLCVLLSPPLSPVSFPCLYPFVSRFVYSYFLPASASAGLLCLHSGTDHTRTRTHERTNARTRVG